MLLYTATSTVSTRIHLNKQLVNNTYSIDACYTMQGSPAMTFYEDTMTIGALPHGTYKIHVNCYRSLDDNQCTYLDTTSDSLIFTVLPPVSVPAISSNTPAIYPNPANKLSYINSNIQEAVIYNAQGITTGRYTANAPIDISAYPQGVYFIQLKTDIGLFINKFIKE